MAVISAANAKPSPTTSVIPSAFRTNAELKPLCFDPEQLEGLSARNIESHWRNNYGGSLRALNVVKQHLNKALEMDDMPAYIYNALKREHLMRVGSVVLHELYFDNLAPPGERNADLDRALASAFGTAATWEREFRRIGSGLGGGSGWVVLAWNHHLGTLENYWMADHVHSPASSTPLLVMDMYEHSYHMDYGASAGKYIDAFLKNVKWDEVARRLDSARNL